MLVYLYMNQQSRSYRLVILRNWEQGCRGLSVCQLCIHIMVSWRMCLISDSSGNAVNWWWKCGIYTSSDTWVHRCVSILSNGFLVQGVAVVVAHYIWEVYLMPSNLCFILTSKTMSLIWPHCLYRGIASILSIGQKIICRWLLCYTWPQNVSRAPLHSLFSSCFCHCRALLLQIKQRSSYEWAKLTQSENKRRESEKKGKKIYKLGYPSNLW